MLSLWFPTAGSVVPRGDFFAILLLPLLLCTTFTSTGTASLSFSLVLGYQLHFTVKSTLFQQSCHEDSRAFPFFLLKQKRCKSKQFSQFLFYLFFGGLLRFSQLFSVFCFVFVFFKINLFPLEFSIDLSVYSNRLLRLVFSI